ncbi:MAG: pilus assembly PilX N-terminal domain-containing protein [Lachnospiraceae bacterium]|nr:pilus assembly PilX N-terminal domain-containing protein [Lachnospiraceae bacterium]
MKRLLKDKRGSSLAMVMIAMTFMTILGVTVITMTINNIRLKAAQKHGATNFYDTESVVDLLTTGLKNESAVYAQDCYSTALSNFNKASSGSSGTKLSDTYKEEFLTNMIHALALGSSEGTNQSTIAKIDDKIKNNEELYYNDNKLLDYLTVLGKSKTSYYTKHSSSKDNKIEYYFDEGYIVLKNVRVKNKSTMGYYTSITTDIKIGVPDITLDSKSKYLDYIVIADDQLYNQPGTISGVYDLIGSVYTGTINRTSGDDDSYVGILSDGANINISANEIITRGDVLLRSNANVSLNPLTAGVDSYIWAENIATQKTDAYSDAQKKAGKHNTLNITGERSHINVADDLSVTDRFDEVSLEGSYFGYNFNDVNNMVTNAAGNYDLTNIASYDSSAISLNGKGQNFNFSNLDRMLVAGTSYISNKPHAGSTEDANAVAKNSALALGESMTVKSNQIAYFIPAKYIKTCSTDAAETANKTKKFTYNSQTYMFDYKSYSDKYLGFDCSEYYYDDQPVKCYYRHDVDIEAEEIQYFYLMVDPAKDATHSSAERFYSKFMTGTQNTTGNINNLNKQYGIISSSKASALITSAGNILYDLNAAGDVSVKVSNADPTDINSSLIIFEKNLNQQYTSKQLSLLDECEEALNMASAGEYRLRDSGTSNTKSGLDTTGNYKSNLFDTLIDRTKVTDYVSLNGPVKMHVTVDGVDCLVWIVDNPATAINLRNSDGDNGIIIATGNVNVEATSFNGLIISGGDVILNNNAGSKLTADSELIAALLDDAARSDDEAYNLVYNAFQPFYRKAVEEKDEAEHSKTSNVSTINWVKNVD